MTLYTHYYKTWWTKLFTINRPFLVCIIDCPSLKQLLTTNVHGCFGGPCVAWNIGGGSDHAKAHRAMILHEISTQHMDHLSSIY